MLFRSVGLSAGTVAAGLMVTFPGLLDPQWDGYDSRVKAYFLDVIAEAKPLVGRDLSWGAFLGFLGPVGAWGALAFWAGRRRHSAMVWGAALSFPVLLQVETLLFLSNLRGLALAVLVVFFSLPVGAALGVTVIRVLRRRQLAAQGWWFALAFAIFVHFGLVLAFQGRLGTYLSVLMIPSLAVALVLGGVWVRWHTRFTTVLLRGLLGGSLMTAWIVLLSVLGAGSVSWAQRTLLFPSMQAVARVDAVAACDPRTLAFVVNNPALFGAPALSLVVVDQNLPPAVAFFAPRVKLFSLGFYTPDPAAADMITLFTTQNADEVRRLLDARGVEAMLLCVRSSSKEEESPEREDEEKGLFTHAQTVSLPWLHRLTFPSAPGWGMFAVERPEAAR